MGRRSEAEFIAVIFLSMFSLLLVKTSNVFTFSGNICGFWVLIYALILIYFDTCAICSFRVLQIQLTEVNQTAGLSAFLGPLSEKHSSSFAVES